MKKVKNNPIIYSKEQPIDRPIAKLLGDIRVLISSARNKVAQTINIGLVMLNWHIGKRIREDVLGKDRAEYGHLIIATLSQQLGWSHFVEIISFKDPLQNSGCRIHD